MLTKEDLKVVGLVFKKRVKPGLWLYGTPKSRKILIYFYADGTAYVQTEQKISSTRSREYLRKLINEAL